VAIFSHPDQLTDNIHHDHLVAEQPHHGAPLAALHASPQPPPSAPLLHLTVGAGGSPLSGLPPVCQYPVAGGSYACLSFGYPAQPLFTYHTLLGDPAAGTAAIPFSQVGQIDRPPITPHDLALAAAGRHLRQTTKDGTGQLVAAKDESGHTTTTTTTRLMMRMMMEAAGDEGHNHPVVVALPEDDQEEQAEPRTAAVDESLEEQNLKQLLRLSRTDMASVANETVQKLRPAYEELAIERATNPTVNPTVEELATDRADQLGQQPTLAVMPQQQTEQMQVEQLQTEKQEQVPLTGKSLQQEILHEEQMKQEQDGGAQQAQLQPHKQEEHQQHIKMPDQQQHQQFTVLPEPEQKELILDRKQLNHQQQEAVLQNEIEVDSLASATRLRRKLIKEDSKSQVGRMMDKILKISFK
jgi:hypothetical protein